MNRINKFQVDQQIGHPNQQAQYIESNNNGHQLNKSSYSNRNIQKTETINNTNNNNSNNNNSTNISGGINNNNNTNSQQMRRFISEMTPTNNQQPVTNNNTNNTNNNNNFNNQQFQQQQQQQQQNQNYIDINNNNLFNKNLNINTNQFYNNIGGVINTLINSRLVQQVQQNSFLLAANANLQQQQQQQSNGFNNNPNYVDETKCQVCGDKSTGSHFGGISCESCKAFFRRSVQKNRFEDYKCSYSGECKMNTNTRKICQYCRYNKCLSIGMRPKWVLSDDERHQKYGNRRKNKQLPQSANSGTNEDESNKTNSIVTTTTTTTSTKVESTKDEPSVAGEQNENSKSLTHNSSSLNNLNQATNKNNLNQQQNNKQQQQNSNNNNNNSNNDENNTTHSSNTQTSNSEDEMNLREDGKQVENLTKNDINRLGVDGMNMKVLDLSSYEKDLIDRLSIAFYHSRKFNSLDLNVQKKLAVLFQTQSEGSLKKMSKVILANFIVQPVKRVITFAKLIPDFRKLDINDQMSLLQGGAMEIFICSSSTLYDQMANRFVNIVSKDRKIEGNDNSNIQLEIMRLIWSEDVFEKTIGFLKSMSQLGLDEATLILFLPLILFSSDRRDLKDRKQIYHIQSKYSLLLKKYMIWKFGKLNADKLYRRLLLKLIELRSLHEMHSSILLDADSSQLDPFPLAILLNQKEEAAKINSTNPPLNSNNNNNNNSSNGTNNNINSNEDDNQINNNNNISSNSDQTPKQSMGDETNLQEKENPEISNLKTSYSSGNDSLSNLSILTPDSTSMNSGPNSLEQPPSTYPSP